MGILERWLGTEFIIGYLAIASIVLRYAPNRGASLRRSPLSANRRIASAEPAVLFIVGGSLSSCTIK